MPLVAKGKRVIIVSLGHAIVFDEPEVFAFASGFPGLAAGEGVVQLVLLPELVDKFAKVFVCFLLLMDDMPEALALVFQLGDPDPVVLSVTIVFVFSLGKSSILFLEALISEQDCVYLLQGVRVINLQGDILFLQYCYSPLQQASFLFVRSHHPAFLRSNIFRHTVFGVDSFRLLILLQSLPLLPRGKQLFSQLHEVLVFIFEFLFQPTVEAFQKFFFPAVALAIFFFHQQLLTNFFLPERVLSFESLVGLSTQPNLLLQILNLLPQQLNRCNFILH